MAPIPITIVTGFLGSGKTTLILNLVPQLRAADPAYRLALLKNEFGDLAVDSQLAASGAVAGVRELLNGCICCNLVGQLGDALAALRAHQPSRIVVETSGSAFPATLALEVNRLARATGGQYALDGVVSVVDVENWQGYDDTSYTARLQARYTDLVVFNKWEACDERRFDLCLDRLGDLHPDGDVAWVKSRRGWVDAALVFGIDGSLAKALPADADQDHDHQGHDHHDHDHDHHSHKDDHQSEVDVLSVTLQAPPTATTTAAVDVAKLLRLLRAAPKEEVYRIKAVLAVAAAARPQLVNSDSDIAVASASDGDDAATTSEDSSDGDAATTSPYILNWAFGRWTFTPLAAPAADATSPAAAAAAALRMTVVLARDEGAPWAKKLQTGDWLALAEGGAGAGAGAGELTVNKIA